MELVAKLQSCGLLDRAYALAQPTFILYLKEARNPGQDLKAWSAGICMLARTAHLADTSDTALNWLEQAMWTLDALRPTAIAQYWRTPVFDLYG